MQEDLTRATYDAVYAALPKSPTLRRLWHEHVEGPDFPEEFGHVSFVTLSQLRRMATELHLKPGDTLVVITDGVTEAESGSGELFGEERLYNLLSTLRGRSAFEVKEAIVESVRNFSYPKGASDDLTILVLKRKE